MKKCLLFLMLTVVAFKSHSQRSARLDEIKGYMQALVKTIPPDLDNEQSRYFTNAAFANLICGRSPALSEKWLRRVFDRQDMNPSSGTYGYLPWRVNDASFSDLNAVEFSTSCLGPIMTDYAGVLSDSFKTYIQPHMVASIAALKKRNIRMGYTNIFLMENTNIIVLGKVLNDQAAINYGIKKMDDWIAYSQLTNFHEFNSTNYSSVAMHALYTGYLYAPDESTKAKYKTLLDRLWEEMSANYNPNPGTLSGPRSREYNQLYGHEAKIDALFYIEGFMTHPGYATVPDLQTVYPLLNGYKPDGYVPESRLLNWCPERIITTTWDTFPGAQNYNYICPDFSMGSASRSFGALNNGYAWTDKLINIEIASRNKTLPDIVIIPDKTDKPYGSNPSAIHTPHHPVSAQEKGYLLTVLDHNPSVAGNLTSYSTNIILPAKADTIWLDGKKISTDAVFEMPVTFASVIGIKEGNTGMAFRIFRSDNYLGNPPQMFLKLDADGLNNKALRLCAYHYKGPQVKLTTTHLKVGALIIGEHCEDFASFEALINKVKNAEITDTVAGTLWKVGADVGGKLLETGMDVNTRYAVYRKVDGHEMKFDLFSVTCVDGTVASIHEKASGAYSRVFNYPNPFSDRTTIQYRTPGPGHVEIKIYDASGREIQTLVDQEQPGGAHEAVFEAGNLPEGLYFYKVISADNYTTGKMLVTAP